MNVNFVMSKECVVGVCMILFDFLILRKMNCEFSIV